MESDQEIRLRLIEAAARQPFPHREGLAAGVLETARAWEQYVTGAVGAIDKARSLLGLPKKAS